MGRYGDGILSQRQFHADPIPGLSLPQQEAVGRAKDSTGVSIGGDEIVKFSKGQRNRLREATTEADVAAWGDIEEPGIKGDQVQRAAHRYGMVGPHRRLGEVILGAYRH